MLRKERYIPDYPSNRSHRDHSTDGGAAGAKVEYKNIDPKLVVNEIRNGRSLESVQKLFNIKFKSEVQDLYLRGLMEMGEIPQVEFGKGAAERARSYTPPPPPPAPSAPERAPVVRRRERPVAPEAPSTLIKTSNFRTIGQSGSITLNKALLIEQLGFGVGDSFEIFREDDSVILKKTATQPN